jgi:hypothetical protein
MAPSKFCSNCGTAVAENAGFCASCGTAVGSAAPAAPAAPQAPAQPIYPQPTYSSPPKSKTTAVVLAVFLSWWSWLYTFKRNKAKFFIALSLSTLATIVAIAYLVALTQEATSMYTACVDDAYYNDTDVSACTSYLPSGVGGSFIFYLVSFPLWLWALIDNARRPQSYYQNFPNER